MSHRSTFAPIAINPRYDWDIHAWDSLYSLQKKEGLLAIHTTFIIILVDATQDSEIAINLALINPKPYRVLP
jgi:hypothetical protein